MKLLHFDDFKLGVLNGDNVVDVSDIANEIPHIGPHDRINGLIENFDNFRDRLETAAASGNGTSIANVRIRPPLPKPRQSCRLAGFFSFFLLNFFWFIIVY